MKNKICEYGCENEACFETKADRACCSKSAASCPAVRKKNSDAIKAAHAEGRLKGWSKQENLNRGWSKGLQHINDSRVSGKWKLEDVFCQESIVPRCVVKKFLLSFGRGKLCETCGICEWQEQPIVLELDHINGVHDDNRIENLRFLCPNCHSQTSTFRGRNNNIARLKKGLSQNYAKHSKGKRIVSNDTVYLLTKVMHNDPDLKQKDKECYSSKRKSPIEPMKKSINFILKELKKSGNLTSISQNMVGRCACQN